MPTKTFEHDGRTFEVRAVPTVGSWQIQVYEGGRRVNGTYNLEHVTILNAEQQGRYEGTIEHAMEVARVSIQNGTVKVPRQST